MPDWTVYHHAKEIKEMIGFIEVEIAGLVSLGPVDKSAMESYLCKRADVVKVYLNQ